MTNETARLVEIFSSIQGEGPFVGVRQIFVRFVGCNIRCLYCDTPDAFINPAECQVETRPGSRRFAGRPNPLTAEDLADVLKGFSAVPHHSVSLTGGEPLMHAPFLRLLLPRLKELRLRSYLETNGILSKQLESVIDLLDIISMDIKLPATLRPERDLFSEHQEFLQIAARKTVLVKLVVMADTPDSEVVRAAGLVESVSSSIPLVLQPVTPGGAVEGGPSPEKMLHLHELASGAHKDVRVIPQVHKFIGQI